VPQLAIHLDRQVNEGLTLDKQRHLQPVWGLGDAADGDLIGYLAEEAGLDAEDVVGWDLMTHDTQPPAYLGRDKDLLAAPRLDNLLSVHAGTAALAAAVSPDLPYIPVLAAFDHEENGSESDTGAQGPLLGNVLTRSVHARGGSYEDSRRALAATVCVSSDSGHAVHPNYAERHDPTHHPRANGGPILKTNVNQRYATDGTGRGLFAAACDRVGVPFQHFVSSNAMPCGTTIGPITSARHGITTVDVGVPILSMHSARELCGADDPHLLASALKSFLEE
jgi:aspartyl aminopeptidase